MDKKSGNKVASKPSKNDVRYWLARVFKPRSVQRTRVYEAAFYFARFQYAGRRMALSLGTANQMEAAARAKERYLYLTTNGWRPFLAKYRSDHESAELDIPVKTNITVGEFIEAAAAASSLAPSTIGPYARAFRRIAAEVFGIKGGRKRFDYRTGGNQQWLDKVHAVPLALITPEKISDWKKKFVARAGNDIIARRRATVSCNSFVRQARALFSRRTVLDKLKGIELPAILPFDGVSVERRTNQKFYGCGIDPYQLMRDAIAELGETRPEELKAFLLALVLGLRRRECDTLEWASFDFQASTVHVLPTRWYALKTNESAAELPVEPEILELFRGWRARAAGDFVIESNREPKAVDYQWYRCELVFNNLLAWLRAKRIQATKPFHALRKLYGSMLAEKHGLHAASSGLRHADLRTTSEVYVDRRVKVTPGLGAVFSELSSSSSVIRLGVRPAAPAISADETWELQP
jgi:integrase